jgi:hypothetical protein
MMGSGIRVAGAIYCQRYMAQVAPDIAQSLLVSGCRYSQLYIARLAADSALSLFLAVQLELLGADAPVGDRIF